MCTRHWFTFPASRALISFTFAGLTSTEKETSAIDHFHNGSLIKYSFVLMLISLSSLSAMRKIQKNMLTKMRPEGPLKGARSRNFRQFQH